eukprot:TRINITY_DN7223_c0_g1_i1.p1 TRINITY_DN7223_c0_g1~~TRINITY_DN7223_c0_g1_i1.p1  ORF type:complete len:432 (+),score=62.71 TRINITY_DN7223_c0_g1_i1:35-1297(+)
MELQPLDKQSTTSRTQLRYSFEQQQTSEQQSQQPQPQPQPLPIKQMGHQRCPEGACCGNPCCYCCCGWLQDWWFRHIRQELRGFAPEFTVVGVVLFFSILGAVLVGVGCALLVAALSVHEVKVRYDHLTWDPYGDVSENITFEVTEKIEQPVYVYFEVTNYFQNQKRYVKSVDMSQLSGSKTPEDSPDRMCGPQMYVGFPDKRNELYENDGILYPCGLVAWSNFNDTFQLDGFFINSSDIAWSTDVDYVYNDEYLPVNFNKDFSNGTEGEQNISEYRGGATTDTYMRDSQHFMVWMKPGVHPTIRKLYGQISSDLEPGNYTATISNSYNVYEDPLEGEPDNSVIQDQVKKYMVISHKSWYGGSSLVIGITWIASGGVSLIAAAVLYLLSLLRYRKPGDLNDVTWIKKERKLAELHGWNEN